METSQHLAHYNNLNGPLFFVSLFFSFSPVSVHLQDPLSHVTSTTTETAKHTPSHFQTTHTHKARTLRVSAVGRLCKSHPFLNPHLGVFLHLASGAGTRTSPFVASLFSPHNPYVLERAAQPTLYIYGYHHWEDKGMFICCSGGFLWVKMLRC